MPTWLCSDHALRSCREGTDVNALTAWDRWLFGFQWEAMVLSSDYSGVPNASGRSSNTSTSALTPSPPWTSSVPGLRAISPSTTGPTANPRSATSALRPSSYRSIGRPSPHNQRVHFEWGISQIPVGLNPLIPSSSKTLIIKERGGLQKMPHAHVLAVQYRISCEEIGERPNPCH